MFKRFIVRSSALTLLAVSAGLVAQSAPVEAPIVIDSVNNEYDLRSGLTRFYDDVSIERGSMRISADEGVVRQADGEIVSIELSGNPTTWEDRLEDGSLVQGEARRIHFDVQKNVITLTAGARIRHEQGEFTGDELIYDLDSENLVGRGSADNRARVVIEPDAMRRREDAEPPSSAPATPADDAPPETSTRDASGDEAAPEPPTETEDPAVDPVDPPDAD